MAWDKSIWQPSYSQPQNTQSNLYLRNYSKEACCMQVGQTYTLVLDIDSGLKLYALCDSRKLIVWVMWRRPIISSMIHMMCATYLLPAPRHSWPRVVWAREKFLLTCPDDAKTTSYSTRRNSKASGVMLLIIELCLEALWVLIGPNLRLSLSGFPVTFSRTLTVIKGRLWSQRMWFHKEVKELGSTQCFLWSEHKVQLLY